MALSGSIGNTFTTGYRLQLDWTATQDTSANTSSVTATLKLISLGSSYTISSTAAKTGHIVIAGTTYTNTTLSAALTGNQTKTLFSATKTINHNADGTATFTLDGDFGINVTLNGTYYGTVGLTATTFTLNTIPRGSLIDSWGNFTIGTGSSGTIVQTVYSYRNSTSYANRWTFKYGSTTLFTTAKLAQDTYNLTEGNIASLYALIPNATAATITVSVDTFASTTSTTQIGTTDTASAVATLDSTVVPTISSVSLTEADANALALALGTNRFVKGVSDLQFSITAAGAKSSTISSYKVVLNSTNYTSTTSPITVNNFNTSGTFNPAIYAIDSRGRTSAAYSITGVVVQPYTPPAISDFSATRVTGNTTAVALTIGASISGLTTAAAVHKNQLKYTVYSKLKTSATWTTIVAQTTLAAGTLTLSSITGSPFSTYANTSAYDFKVEVTDSLGTSTATSTYYVSTSAAVMSWGTDGVGIGKIYDESAAGTLQVEGQIDVTGKINSTVATGTAPFTVASTTVVTNLNADTLDGNHASAFPIKATATDYLTNEARIAPTLQNSWVNYSTTVDASTGYNQAAYWKDRNGVVHITGLIKSGTATDGTIIFTLPAGYRPFGTEMFTVNSNNAFARIDVTQTGTVVCRIGVNTNWVSFAGISFKAER